MVIKKAFSLLAFGKGAPEGLPLIPDGNLPEPTADEKYNGWDAVSLARYRQERDNAAYKTVFDKPKPKQAKAMNDYSPMKW